MDFHEVIRTRRSVRSYKSDPIPDDVFQRVMDTARLAPSANNIQPWRVVAVKDEARRREVAHQCYDQDFIARAPVVLVICAERYRDSYSWIEKNMYLIDTTIFVDHLALAARAEGLGTCWIGAFDADGHKKIKRLLDVPDSHDVVMVMPIGYPERAGAFRDPGHRKSLSDVVSYDAF